MHSAQLQSILMTPTWDEEKRPRKPQKLAANQAFEAVDSATPVLHLGGPTRDVARFGFVQPAKAGAGISVPQAGAMDHGFSEGDGLSPIMSDFPIHVSWICQIFLILGTFGTYAYIRITLESHKRINLI